MGMTNTRQKKESQEHLDAWDRFERTVDVVAKSPPQHRTKAKPAKGPKVRSFRRRVSSAKPKNV
jgi:ferric-dicitrate binding protein FerR (iron transport regulator)